MPLTIIDRKIRVVFMPVVNVCFDGHMKSVFLVGLDNEPTSTVRAENNCIPQAQVTDLEPDDPGNAVCIRDIRKINISLVIEHVGTYIIAETVICKIGTTLYISIIIIPGFVIGIAVEWVVGNQSCHRNWNSCIQGIGRNTTVPP